MYPINYLRPLSTPEVKEMMQDARIRYQFKRSQLTKGLGRTPTSKEMERVANGDIFAITLGNTLLRARGEGSIPESLLVQTFMAMLRT